MRSIGFAAIGICLLIAFTTPTAKAQTAATGALTVNVLDSTRAVIPGADVVVTSAATGQTRTEISNEKGTATFSLLPVGNYSVTISLAGFKTAQISPIVINVTETRVL